jgi:signal transduction histidine kinase
MNNKLTIKKIIFCIIVLIFLLFMISSSFVLINIINLEKDKLVGISPRVIRVLSNDLLLGDKYSLNHTIAKLNSLYDLDSIHVTIEKTENCALFELSCIVTQTSLIEPEYNITIRGNKTFSKKIIYSYLLTFIGLIIIFSILSVLLFKKIKKPLENISEKLIPKLLKHIENGEKINYKIVKSTKEIDEICKNLIEMSENLYSSKNNLNDVLIKSQINDAIANSTKMFAHDVRKPFSIIKLLIDNIEKENDFEKVKSILTSTIPFMNQAKNSVDNLISDILEIGSDAIPKLEAITPEILINSVIRELLLTENKKYIEFNYDFNHCYQINADKNKIHRVFSNIIFNAIEAINKSGKIWIKTKETRINENLFIEFCVGNNGSYISKEKSAKIFDAFFTYNKLGGTGLGLAIVQKIIRAHGGTIACSSEFNEDKSKCKVEFIFTLPISKILKAPILIDFAKSTKDISFQKLII